MYNYGKRHLLVYQREAIIILLSSIALFLGVALFFHNPGDSSWLFYDSEGVCITNPCGIVGAHSAAFLFYLFGSASLVLIGIIVLGIYIIAYKKRLAQEWDRLLALFMLMFVIATLNSMYAIDWFSSSYPGGFFGYSLKELLYRWFDQVGSTVFVYTLLLLCSIIVARSSYITLTMRMLSFIGSCDKQKHIPKMGRQMINRIAHYSKIPLAGIHNLIGRFHTLLFGVQSQESDYASLSLPYDYVPEMDTIHNDQIWHELMGKKEMVPGNKEVAPQPVSVTQKNPPSSHDNIEQKITSSPYQLPDLSIFVCQEDEVIKPQIMKELEARARTLEEKLERFGVSGNVVSIKRGPVVTLFEYQPEIDSKISKIVALEDDLALALQALSIRIIAPIPGKSVVGFEVANAKRHNVAFADVVNSPAYKQFSGSLPLILGKNTIGAHVVVDLVKMPHLLVAGSTGSGKSVALNAMLISMLCKCKPEELRLILIDPKRLEFSAYADIAHLLFPIITNPRQAAPVLKWVVQEMEDRYAIMAEKGARSIADYNNMVPSSEAKPLIVVVIDELADLMMTAPKDVEFLIGRITQMARAAGIHMLVATQRPSVDVITGLIKVNFPSRISFRVTSKIDSRTILDCAGADKLLGRGDMLFLDSSDAQLKRVHGAYVSDSEIAALMNHIRAQQLPNYLDISQELSIEKNDGMDAVDETLYEEVLAFLKEVDEVSISLLQRKFRIGYNRSARIIELLQARGLVLPSEGGKTRKVVR